MSIASPPIADERRALTLALAAVALWSTVATAFKLGLEVLATAQLLLLGTAISTVVFTAYAWQQGQLKLPARHLLTAFGFGLVNPVIYYLVLFEAYARLPAQIAQPLNYTWAIVLAMLAVPLLGQPLDRRTMAGIAVGYAGVLVLLSQGSFTTLPELDWTGVALAIGSTVLWAGYWLLNTRVEIPAAPLMAWSFLFATPLLWAICLIGPGLPPLNATTLAAGAWVGLFEMGVTFLLWQAALARTRQAGRLGQLIFLSPFLSLLLIAAILGEQIHYTSVLGLAIIVAGLVITRRPGDL